MHTIGTNSGAAPSALDEAGGKVGPATADPARKQSNGASRARKLAEPAWSWPQCRKVGDRLHVEPQPGPWAPYGGLLLGTTEPFILQRGQLAVIEVGFTTIPANALLRIELALAEAKQHQCVAERELESSEQVSTALVHVPQADARYVLRFRIMGTMLDGTYRGNLPVGFSFSSPEVALSACDSLPAIEMPPTELPHWGPLARAIHRLAKRSRTFNSLVAALEVRLGREEVLSLPQYVAICPTGQCNATCAFCSVTINRTGIVKRQLALDNIRRFTAPAARTVRMYGIEGNGEPMLYRGFDSLVHHVLSDGAIAYLITNASQIDAQSLPLLLGFDSINISMNAATAATHRRVMGLKNFEEICGNIRELTRRRGRRGEQPHISISLVVTRDNIFEAVAFLRLAEDLGVDRALLRPLSELGNESGAVEDLRALVPYESEVADLMEAVEDYLQATTGKRRVEIHFQPENFKATRPDPPADAIQPIDRPDVVPMPRPRYWQSAAPAVTAAWPEPGRLRISATSDHAGGACIRSDLVPVPPYRTMSAEIAVRSSATRLLWRVRSSEGVVLAEVPLAHGDGTEFATARADWGPAPTLAVSFEIDSASGAFEAEFDLGRVRKPGPLVDPFPAIPAPNRWELASPGAVLNWSRSVQTIRWSGPAGPYLAKSYSRQCLPHVTMAYPLRVEVRSGRLGIGILSQDFQSWVKTFDFGSGTHASELTFDTGANRRFQVVVYSATDAPLDASVDWTEAMRPRPTSQADLPRIMAMAQKAVATLSDAPRSSPSALGQKLERREAQRQARAELQTATPLAPPSPPPTGRSNPGGSWLRLFRDDRTIYCHKPWTDMANFTIDGRVDVCCIATGASQSRFALGNLSQQGFQEVWNGPTAREFRRTVNDPKTALPPCQRCPMAKAYAGPLLNPEATLFSAWSRFDRAPLNRTRLGRYTLFAVFAVSYLPLHMWLFRGYDKPPLKASIAKIRGGNGG